MTDAFIQPNWHIILIHYPLGLLGIGLLIEILSFFWRRSSVRAAGRWMLLIGALSCIPAATLGLYALREVVAPGSINTDETWRSVVARSQWNEVQWEHMVRHLQHAIIGTVAAVLAAFLWLACSDRGRQRFYWPALILLVIAVGFLDVGAWHSGEGIYRYGVAIQQPSTQEQAMRRDGAITTPPGPSTMPFPGANTQAAGSELVGREDAKTVLGRVEETLNAAKRELRETTSNAYTGPRKLEYFIQPLQLHVLLAGLTVAIALGAFGVTIRRWKVMRLAGVAVLPSGATHPAELPEHRLRADLPNVGPSADPSPGLSPIPQIFPARLWLWAFLFAIATAASGLWFTDDWKLRVLTEPLSNRFAIDQIARLFAHAAGGVKIIVFLLLGAILTRLAKRHRPLTVVVMLILVLLVVGQIWLGVLLLFDSRYGPLMRFN